MLTPEPEPPPTTTTPEPEPEHQGLQCDPPRSQLEAEQCAGPEHPEPQPEPEPTPDICNDGLDNEGEPGLVDGEDPNCQ